MNRSFKLALVVGFLFSITFFIIQSCGKQQVDLTKPAVYVGSAKCQECHEGVYDGWKSTLHPHQFKEASPNAIVGDFELKNTLAAGGYTSKMFKKDNKFFVTTKGPEGKEGTYEVKYVLGGFWKQRYVTEFPNGGLHILPVQWIVKAQKWEDFRGLEKQQPGDGVFWADKARTYQFNCTGCHDVGIEFKYDVKTDKYENTNWIEKSVGCERCHGPGSNHVDAPIEQKVKTIVNPAKLHDPTRAALVCGQCHTRGESKGKLHNFKKTEYPSLTYRPGDPVVNFDYDTKPGLNPDGSAKDHRQQYLDY